MRKGGRTNPRFAAWEDCSKFSLWPGSLQSTNWESLATIVIYLRGKSGYFGVGVVKVSNLRQDFVSRKRKFWSRDRRHAEPEKGKYDLARNIWICGLYLTKSHFCLLRVYLCKEKPHRTHTVVEQVILDVPWSRKVASNSRPCTCSISWLTTGFSTVVTKHMDSCNDSAYWKVMYISLAYSTVFSRYF